MSEQGQIQRFNKVSSQCSPRGAGGHSQRTTQRHPESEAVPRMLYLTATTGSVQLLGWPHSLIPFHPALWGMHHLPADFVCKMALIGNLSEPLSILDIWG